LRLRAGHAGASSWYAASALGALVIIPFFHDVLALSHLLLKTTPIVEVKNKTNSPKIYIVPTGIRMNIPNILALDNRPVRLTLSTRQGINAVSEVPPLLKSPAVVQETTFIRVTIIVTIVLVIFAIILIVVCMRVQEQHVAQYFFRFCDAGELSGLFRRGFNNNKNENLNLRATLSFNFKKAKRSPLNFVCVRRPRRCQHLVCCTGTGRPVVLLSLSLPSTPQQLLK